MSDNICGEGEKSYVLVTPAAVNTVSNIAHAARRVSPSTE